MLNIEVDYMAVIVAAVASMAVGFLWYSPLVLGKPWMKLKGYTPASLKKAQQEMGKLYGISFVAALVTAFVLLHVITLSQDFYGLSKIQTGLTTAFWIWLGFIMPVQLADEIFGGHKWGLLAINTGYQLTSILVMAVAIAYI